MLKVDGLAKAFGELRAVDAVSFTAPDGVITGFLGANGAGKTTVMRMIMGLLLPDAGRISWNGHSLKAETRRRFGYMPEERGLYPKQRVADQLAYFGQLRGLSSRDSNQQAKELLEQFGLADRARAKLETLSLGNQQRVQIIASLMGVPRMLILDEPFSGLDPLATDEMVGLLRSRAREGAPVLFSSHQLDVLPREVVNGVDR